MSGFRFHSRAVAGLLLFGCPFFSPAQTASTQTSITVTSGMVGVNSGQSVRLNVLNLQPVVTGVTAVVCPATLEIYNDSGAQLTQMQITDIPPANAANLVYKPVVPATPANARVEIRAVVVTPTPTAIPVATPGSPIVMATVTACSLMPSLEITNDANGSTQVVTTDFRTTPLFGVVTPVASGQAGK